MANISKWSNVKISMQSALASALTIGGITKANPGVVTSTAHGLSNGAFVLMTVVGMSQLNGRVFRVANVATDTFELEGEDTTNFDTFTSGTAQAITFGTSLGTVTGVSGTGGDFSFIDTTTVHDSIETQIPGIATALTYTLENLWDVADAALIAMKSASDNQAQRAFSFTFANGQIMVFNGYVGTSLVPGGSTQDKVTTPVTITAFGTPTYYAS